MNVIADYEKYVIPCYKKVPVVYERGRGTVLWDDKGRRYLDFFSGWAVSGLGHSHPGIVRAVARQASRLMHVPNNYYHAGHARLAGQIIRRAFPGKVFFCNSGAEAVEGAIKLARTRGYPKRTEIVTMHRSFHGRTIGAMSATGQAKFHKGIKPLLGGFKMVPFNDTALLKKAVTTKTAAVLLELVQGEGGVNVADRAYVRELRKICDRTGALMIADEVQTGMGRTGEIFCFKHYGIKPDVMLLAKSLGGGFPIGALVASSKVADVLKAGTHASTFGGSPIACAAGLAVFEVMRKEKVLMNVRRMSRRLFAGLQELKSRHPVVREVRGLGLLAAMELGEPAGAVYDYCLKRGVLINVTQERVLRLAPPLNVRAQDVDRTVGVMDGALGALFGDGRRAK